MKTYRNALGSTCGGRNPCRIPARYRQKKRFLQGHGCHLQTEPELNERLSREKIRVFFQAELRFFEFTTFRS